MKKKLALVLTAALAAASLTASPPIGRRMRRKITLRATRMTSL